jgi:uroporphyrinogen-III synthase
MRVLLTRTEDDAAPLAMQLARLGIASTIDPLLEIHVFPGDAPDLGNVQALLFTSANGARAFARRCPRRDLPVLAVGDATARTAAEFGFTTVESAGGDVLALAELARQTLDPGAGTLLHAAGSVTAGDLAKLLADDGFDVQRQVLYEARMARRLTPATVEMVRRNRIDGVVLFSPRTAAVFVDLAQSEGLSAACGRLTAFCLSWAVADAIEALAWRRVAVAARPEQGAIVDMIADAADFFSRSGRFP